MERQTLQIIRLLFFFLLLRKYTRSYYIDMPYAILSATCKFCSVTKQKHQLVRYLEDFYQLASNARTCQDPLIHLWINNCHVCFTTNKKIRVLISNFSFNMILTLSTKEI